MGMIFNSVKTLEIIAKLNNHYAPGSNFNTAVANDPGPLTVRSSSTYQKSHAVGIDVSSGSSWQNYLDKVVDHYTDANHAGSKLGNTIITAMLGYLADQNCVGIQFFANYSTTQCVSLFKEPAPNGKYFGSILVTSFSLDEALAEQQLARGRPPAPKGSRSGVQAPAARRKKSET